MMTYYDHAPVLSKIERLALISFIDVYHKKAGISNKPSLGRIALEGIVRNLHRRHNLTYKEKIKQRKRVQFLVRKKILPYELGQLSEPIIGIGNATIHLDELEVNTTEVIEMCLRTIFLWYYNKYYKTLYLPNPLDFFVVVEILNRSLDFSSYSLPFLHRDNNLLFLLSVHNNRAIFCDAKIGIVESFHAKEESGTIPFRIDNGGYHYRTEQFCYSFLKKRIIHVPLQLYEAYQAIKEKTVIQLGHQILFVHKKRTSYVEYIHLGQDHLVEIRFEPTVYNPKANTLSNHELFSRLQKDGFPQNPLDPNTTKRVRRKLVLDLIASADLESKKLKQPISHWNQIVLNKKNIKNSKENKQSADEKHLDMYIKRRDDLAILSEVLNKQLLFIESEYFLSKYLPLHALARIGIFHRVYRREINSLFYGIFFWGAIILLPALIVLLIKLLSEQ